MAWPCRWKGAVSNRVPRSCHFPRRSVRFTSGRRWAGSFVDSLAGIDAPQVFLRDPPVLFAGVNLARLAITFHDVDNGAGFDPCHLGCPSPRRCQRKERALLHPGGNGSRTPRTPAAPPQPIPSTPSLSRTCRQLSNSARTSTGSPRPPEHPGDLDSPGRARRGNLLRSL